MLHHKPPSGKIKLQEPIRTRPLHKPPRVLVAEDDAEMLELIVQTLRKDGYAPQVARDGGRLLVSLTAQFREGNVDVDLLISDIRMPVCTGLDILEAMRKARWTAPAILMTAFGDEETRRRAEAAGAVLLDKPFSLDQLRATVARLMPLE